MLHLEIFSYIYGKTAAMLDECLMVIFGIRRERIDETPSSNAASAFLVLQWCDIDMAAWEKRESLWLLS